MSEEIVFRPMTRADVGAVYEVECVCFRSPWSKLSLLGELRNSVAHYIVLEADGKVQGYGGLWALFEEAHVTNVAVMPALRGRGNGKRLLLAMMATALSLGCTKMTLEVREHNIIAQSMYHKLGFLQNGFRARYYDDTGEGALILWNENIKATWEKEQQNNETV